MNTVEITYNNKPPKAYFCLISKANSFRTKKVISLNSIMIIIRGCKGKNVK